MIELRGEDLVWETTGEHLVRALEHGVGTESFAVTADNELIVAAGVWGAYGSVVSVSNDEDEPGCIEFDVYALRADEHGRWIPPGGAGGGSLPQSFLRRPDHGDPDWQGAEIVSFGGQPAWFGDDTVVDVSVMASRQVATVEIRYREREVTVVVPESGLVTVPVEVVSQTDLVRLRARAHDGVVLDDLSLPPLVDGSMIRSPRRG